MYRNLLYLPLFNFSYQFILSFFSSQHICQFYFHCFIPEWAPCFSLVFQFVFQLVMFLTGKYNIWFPLFTRSIYCTLFLWDCFYFAYGYICICVYSVTLFTVVINLCLYIGLLQFCGVFLPPPPSVFFSIISIFNILKLLYFSTLICLPFLLFFSPCS